MEDDAWAELLSRSTRARARSRALQKLKSLAHTRHTAQAQNQAARAAVDRARKHTDQRIRAWLDTHGLPTPREDHQEDLGLVLGGVQQLFRSCNSVSLTTVDQLAGAREPYTTAAYSGVADVLDAAQYRLREGPCIEAIELDMIADMRAGDFVSDHDKRTWPRLAKVATSLGVRSSLSIAVPWSPFHVGLQAEQAALGAINLYAPEPHAFDRTEDDVRLLGSWAASILSGVDLVHVYNSP